MGHRTWFGAAWAVCAGVVVAQEVPPPPASVVIQTFVAADAPRGDVTAFHFDRRPGEGVRLGFSTLFMGVEYCEETRDVPLAPEDERALAEAAEALRRERGFAWGTAPAEREGRSELQLFWDDLDSQARLPLSDLRRLRLFAYGAFESPPAARLVALATRLAEQERARQRQRLAQAPLRTVVGEVSPHGRRLAAWKVHEASSDPVIDWTLERSDWNLPDGRPAYLIRDARGDVAVIPQEWLLPAFHPQGVVPGKPLVFRAAGAWAAQGRGRSYHPAVPLGAPADEQRTLEELWEALHTRPTRKGQRGLSDLSGQVVRVTGRALDTSAHSTRIEVERCELLDPTTLEPLPERPDAAGLVGKLR